MNLMEAYQKTMTSDGFILQLFDWLDSQELTLLAPYLFVRETAAQIDNFYYYAWSGDKTISATLEKFWDEEDQELKNQSDLIQMWWHIHYKNLIRQWNNFMAEYKAEEPYHVTETTGYTHEGGSTVTDSGEDTKTRSGYVREGGSVQTTTQVWGFDADTDAVNSDKTTVKYNPDNDGKYTQYDNVEDSISYGKTRESGDSSQDDLVTEKTGNLGIIPIADLIQKDIELWQWNFYKQCLFPAIDSMLTLPIY